MPWKFPFPTVWCSWSSQLSPHCQSLGHGVTPRNLNPRPGPGITLKPHTITTLYAALIKRLEVFLVPHSKSIYRIPGVNGLLRVALLLGVSISRNYLAFSYCCFHWEIALDLEAPKQTGQQCSSLQTLTGERPAPYGLMKLVYVQYFFKGDNRAYGATRQDLKDSQTVSRLKDMEGEGEKMEGTAVEKDTLGIAKVWQAGSRETVELLVTVPNCFQLWAETLQSICRSILWHAVIQI